MSRRGKRAKAIMRTVRRKGIGCFGRARRGMAITLGWLGGHPRKVAPFDDPGDATRDLWEPYRSVQVPGWLRG